MKFIIFIFLLLVSFAPVSAATPTPESSSSAANTPEIQKIREVIQQKVKEKLQQITTTSPDTTSPKSLVGTITQINDQEITIEYQKTTQTILVSDTTTFIDQKRNKTSLEKIKTGQDILVLGYFNSENILETKRLILVDFKILENTNQVVVGKIVDVSQSSPVFVLIPSKDKNTQFQIKTDDKTEYVDGNNKKITQKKLMTGQKLIVIIKPDAKIAKTFYASKVIINDPISLTPTLKPSPTPKN